MTCLSNACFVLFCRRRCCCFCYSCATPKIIPLNNCISRIHIDIEHHSIMSVRILFEVFFTYNWQAWDKSWIAKKISKNNDSRHISISMNWWLLPHSIRSMQFFSVLCGVVFDFASILFFFYKAVNDILKWSIRHPINSQKSCDALPTQHKNPISPAYILLNSKHDFKVIVPIELLHIFTYSQNTFKRAYLVVYRERTINYWLILFIGLALFSSTLPHPSPFHDTYFVIGHIYYVLWFYYDKTVICFQLKCGLLELAESIKLLGCLSSSGRYPSKFANERLFRAACSTNTQQYQVIEQAGSSGTLIRNSVVFTAVLSKLRTHFSSS